MYKICFITLLIRIAFAIIIGLVYESTRNTIICHTEYEETLSVIVNVPNTDYCHWDSRRLDWTRLGRCEHPLALESDWTGLDSTRLCWCVRTHTHFPYYSFDATLMVMTKVIDRCR